MDPFGELLGDSPAMEALRGQLRRLSAWRESGRRLPAILLHGETGTGKGLLARLIHRAGPRRAGPFVDLNCAAIPDTLLEAELFGFERGAFTDARRAKPGLFQTAHRGVLFLDEVALLPEPLQAKLLKVLEDQAVRRLGATHAEPADVWVIAATNADLAAAIRARAFREDLYHRLAVLTLTLPPLRARGPDVLALADLFLARVCRDYGLPRKALAADARARLLAHPWPGNVRELANVIERAALLAEAPLVTEAMLALPAAGPAPAAGVPAPAAPRAAGSLDDTLADHLRAALDATGGNISRAAQVLGISRNTVRARMARLGLGPGRPGRRAAAPRPAPPAAAPEPPAAPVGPAAPPVIRWERHSVTLLRVRLAEAPDGAEPADAARALPALLDKVRTFGGRVEDVGRTEFDASFGVEAAEAAPQLAAHAALAVRKFAERARRAGEGEAAPLLALHTEPCLVGVMGGALQIDQDGKRRMSAVLDDLLARAPAGAALVSPAAAAFLERRFTLLPIAGHAGRQLEGHTGLGLDLSGRPSPFVGRGHELEVLQGRFAAAREGRGQLVGVVGDAGVGKSRLVRELARSLPDPALVLETAAVAIGTPTPLHPVAELLRRHFHVDTAEGGAAIRKAVEERLGALDPALAPAAPAIASLLDTAAADAEWAGLAPAARRRRTFDAVKQMLLREAARRPLCLIVEDAHWIDTESQAFLDALVDALPGAPILAVCTYRPQYRHPWAARTVYSQLRVDPLPRRDADQLLLALLGADPSLDTLPARLAEWTEGNPFFLEESVRGLVQMGTLEGDPGAYRLVRPVAAIQVPPTVEEVLAGRIDRLTWHQRRILQCAAVIGPDVPVALLARVADIGDAALADGLRALTAAELLFERGGPQDVAYTFAHAVTQEVAYASVAQGRGELHARVLRAMEALYADRLEEHADRLAHHALAGHAWSAALAHLRAAGRRAFARSANHQAAAFLEQGLAVLDRLPDGPEAQALGVDLRLDLRHALTMLGDAPRTVERLREAEGIAERLGDGQRLGRVRSFQANALFLLARYGEAIAAGGRALALADALDDLPLRAATAMYMGRAHHCLGEYERAIALFGGVVDALAGERERDHLGLPILPVVFARSHLAWCLAELGRFGEAEAHAADALRLALARGHPDTLLWAHRAAGLCHLARGAGEAAAAALERALALAQTSDLPVYLSPVSAELGSARALCGRAAEAVAVIAEAEAGAAARQQRMSRPQIALRLAEAALLAGRPADAAVAAQRALDLFVEQRERGHEAHARRVLAEVAWRGGGGDPEDAARGYADAIAQAEALGMRPLAARGRLGLGLLWRAQRDGERSAPWLRAALDDLRAMRMDAWARQAEAALAAL